MRVLITGAAGFIGFHLATRLLTEGHEVLGLDGMTPFYDAGMKRPRLALLAASPRFRMIELMLEDKAGVAAAVAAFEPELVVHLAAQAGVRYSIDHPDTYTSSNVTGTLNLLEALRARPPRHLLFASSSSVYGGNSGQPFREVDRTESPMSLYAATKSAGEALTHSYAHLYTIPTTCFRFFTVYGPWARPDMALFKFVSTIDAGEPIEVFGEGKLERDFTYIADLVEAVRRLIGVVPQVGAPLVAPDVMDSLSPVAPWRTVNIAQGQPIGLLHFIEVIERKVGKPAIKLLRPMQPGDVVATWADPGLLRALTGYVPTTGIEVGVEAFVNWYRDWTARSR